jgi:bifunctional isochorismate lyase/aryl carrier protein
VSGIYLTQASFVKKAREFAESGHGPGRPLFTPGSTALIVIDMQRYFVDPSSHSFVPGAGHILPRVQSLISTFAERALPIVFTRHTNSATDGGALALWWDDLIREEDPLSAITPELDTSLGTVLGKHQYDAFHKTRLESMLRARGVERVIISGVVTHLCCETTARAAFVRGFEVTFPIDSTATYDPLFHLATLRNLSHGFASVAFVDDLLERIAG